MAWKQVDFENGKINLSKCNPYTQDLNLFNKKLGYYHNNRLTAINKWQTDSAVGYKCYKRKANSSHLVDNELTDYIEVNAVDTSGATNHLMDIANKYYKLESLTDGTTGSSANVNFLTGVTIDGVYVGSNDAWAGYTFYKLATNLYLAIKDSSTDTTHFVYMSLKSGGTDSTLTNGWALGNLNNYAEFDAPYKNTYIFTRKYTFNSVSNTYMHFCVDPSTFKASYDKAFNTYAKIIVNQDGLQDKSDDFDVSTTVNFIRIGLDSYSYNATCPFYIKRTYDSTVYKTSEDWWYATPTITCRVYDPYNSDYIHYRIINSTVFDNSKSSSPIDMSYHEYIYSDYPSNRYIENTYGSEMTVYAGSHEDNIVASVAFTPNYSNDIVQVTITSEGIPSSYLNGIVSHNLYFFSAYKHVGTSASFEGTMAVAVNTPQQSKTDITATLSTNYVNDSIVSDSGFILNYTNKRLVSLGHNYKIIVRFDTQGMSYLGSDSTYAYINNNGSKYKISVATMYGDSYAYDSEVNLIESEFCSQVNGYKIFNTTTYYNAIYNDDKTKICCSCDDWNGRYYSTGSSSESTEETKMMLSNSRVGNNWDSTQSWTTIPATAISDELSDIFEYKSPTYHWTNTNYTLHSGTYAYIYTTPSSQEDDKEQTYLIRRLSGTTPSDSDFVSSPSSSSLFLSHSPSELVPSILFTSYPQSDVLSVVQVGSEMYSLKTYSYASATPALVYQSIAESINIDSNSNELVISGAYYTVSGANSFRKIINPYDTSTNTYCCDVTGLKFIGYDSTQAYFYSPAVGCIYAFTGSNKLNKLYELDNHIPKVTTDSSGISVANIPSINLVAMAFTDGVLVLVNGQSIFINLQSVESMSVNREYGLLRINGDYYYFSTNSTIQGLIASSGGKSILNYASYSSLPDLSKLPEANTDTTSDLYQYENKIYYTADTDKYYVVYRQAIITQTSVTYTYSWTETTLASQTGVTNIVTTELQTCKIGEDRLTNVTIDKHRVCIYNDTEKDSTVTISLQSRQGNTIKKETFTKKIPYSQFIDNEYQWEFTPKITKANWFIMDITLNNADLIQYYVDIMETAEENLVK